MSRADAIITEIEQRQIRSLLHVTSAPNLPSIIEHGIYSRDAMHEEIRREGY